VFGYLVADTCTVIIRLVIRLLKCLRFPYHTVILRSGSFGVYLTILPFQIIRGNSKVHISDFRILLSGLMWMKSILNSLFFLFILFWKQDVTPLLVSCLIKSWENIVVEVLDIEFRAAKFILIVVKSFDFGFFVSVKFFHVLQVEIDLFVIEQVFNLFLDIFDFLSLLIIVTFMLLVHDVLKLKRVVRISAFVSLIV